MSGSGSRGNLIHWPSGFDFEAEADAIVDPANPVRADAVKVLSADGVFDFDDEWELSYIKLPGLSTMPGAELFAAAMELDAFELLPHRHGFKNRHRHLRVFDNMPGVSGFICGNEVEIQLTISGEVEVGIVRPPFFIDGRHRKTALLTAEGVKRLIELPSIHIGLFKFPVHRATRVNSTRLAHYTGLASGIQAGLELIRRILSRWHGGASNQTFCSA